MKAAKKGSIAACMVSVFLGAFLLFMVQPLFGKAILPWFGGAASVWATCMVCFQALLFTGYAYAHGSVRWFPPRAQVGLHVGLLLVSLVLLGHAAHGGVPALPAAHWKEYGAEQPAVHLVKTLLVTIGLPFLVLSATAPLLQSWFARQHPERSPYPLYALSNLGSLLALLSYPFVLERLLPLSRQAWLWSILFGAFVVSCIGVAVGVAGAGSAQLRPPEESSKTNDPLPGGRGFAEPRIGNVLLWIALSACASAMLLATTNQLCLTVTSIPFLWVLPLALYLASFVVTFTGRGYPRRSMLGAFVSAVAILAFLTPNHFAVPRLGSWTMEFGTQITIYSLALLVICTVCHGELYLRRPAPRRLTAFYLAVAGGGVLGGLFVSILAPLLFEMYLEFHVALVVTCLVVTLACTPNVRRWRAWVPALLGVAVLTTHLTLLNLTLNRAAFYWKRSFYGVLSVRAEGETDNERRFALLDGDTHHGLQFEKDERRRWPTLYYHETSGVGLAIRHFPRRGPLRVGAIGLGAGAISAYAERGDAYLYFELNPDVIEVATGPSEHFAFRFIADAHDRGARMFVVPGDARLTMERQISDPAARPMAFDVLVLDAFSNTSIPVHLFTVEAFDVYSRVIQPNGVIAVLAGTRHMELEPVVTRIAGHLGYRSVIIRTPDNKPRGIAGCSWVLVTRNEAFLSQPAIRDAVAPPPERRAPLWTDEYTPIWGVLRRR